MKASARTESAQNPTNTKEGKRERQAAAAPPSAKAGLPNAPLYEMVASASGFVDEQTISESRFFSSSVIRTRGLQLRISDPILRNLHLAFVTKELRTLHSAPSLSPLPYTAHARTHARDARGSEMEDGRGATFAAISRAITTPRDPERHSGRWRIERSEVFV